MASRRYQRLLSSWLRSAGDSLQPEAPPERRRVASQGWHLALPTSSVSACPFPPADTHTAHSKNTGAGENEPTTRYVPSYDVRTRTHLAGGRRPASAATATTSVLHSRRRRLDPPDEARDLVVNERHHHPGRPLRRANEGHQPPSCGAVFERATACSGLLLAPSCHRALLLKHC